MSKKATCDICGRDKGDHRCKCSEKWLTVNPGAKCPATQAEYSGASERDAYRIRDLSETFKGGRGTRDSTQVVRMSDMCVIFEEPVEPEDNTILREHQTYIGELNRLAERVRELEAEVDEWKDARR